MTSGGTATMPAMRVGVVDVGSNTVRLLVAARRGGAVEAVHERRAYVRLGDEIDRLGWVSEEKLLETAATVRAYANAAHEHGAHALEVVLTAPGRQAANADELTEALADATRGRARVLSAEEEATFAYVGALSCLDEVPRSVAVCDSGGGSTEIVVGTPAGPTWVRSVDVGSLTVRRSLPGDPPRKDAVAAAREDVHAAFAGIAPPLPTLALATGGTARALRSIVGRSLGRNELKWAIKKLAKLPSGTIADDYDIDPERAWSLPGGAIILAELQLRLGVPFVVARTGLREGVAMTALAKLAAA